MLAAVTALLLAGPASADTTSATSIADQNLVTDSVGGAGGLGDQTETAGTAGNDAAVTDSIATYSNSTQFSDMAVTPTLVTGAAADGTAVDSSTDIVASADPQCSLPLAARTGAWSCGTSGPAALGDVPDTSYDTAAGPQVTATSQAPTVQDTTTPLSPIGGVHTGPVLDGGTTTDASASSLTGYCRVQGCWWHYDDFHADWQSSEFVYGFGKTTIGYGNMYVNWQLTGPKTTIGPAYVILSSSTTSVTGSCALLNGNNSTSGGKLLVGPFFYEWKTPRGPNTRFSWPKSKYCWLREYGSWDHNGDVQFSWHVPGWHGMYWYSYARSIVSHTTTRNTANAIYRFEAASHETKDPAKGGWRPE